MTYFQIMNRFLSQFIIRDLEKKMIFLSGPRQSGKSTLSKNLIPKNSTYLNWDIGKDKKIILNNLWDKKSNLVILDELHKYNKWKNYLKGVCDEYHNSPPLLITGSAKLDTFRKSGDALTGRYFHYRLHPIDIHESLHFFKETNAHEAAKKLISTGGFPEAFTHPKDAERIRQDRFDLVLNEDLRDISKSNSISGLSHLIEILRDKVGSNINHESLSSDLGVSAPTVKSWLELLERLYVIFKVPPYSFRLSTALKKDSKYYFYDCASATDDQGARLENLAASSLLKYCHFRRDTEGKDYQLYYYRDKQKREIDFIVAERTKPIYSIEVKKAEDNFNKNLFYLKDKINPVHNLQLVLDLDRKKEKDGVLMLPLADWFSQLY